jgi:phage/plasmid-like protein (TIGR03299 family)
MNLLTRTENSNLQACGLDWDVELSLDLSANTPSGYGTSTSKVATVRMDTNQILGIVSPDYKIVQNSELWHLAERVSQSQNLTVNTGGCLHGGSRVWLSIQADPFTIGKNDEMEPYLLITNGHDGLHTLSATPTSIRVVCENTLNMALKNGKRDGMCISVRHKGSMNDKIESMILVLQKFYGRMEDFKNAGNYLVKNEFDSSRVDQYFTDVYNRFFTSHKAGSTHESNRRSNNKYFETHLAWRKTFETEVETFGSNAWVAFNSITNMIDHKTSYRGAAKEENRFISNHWGNSAMKKQEILDYTLAL